MKRHIAALVMVFALVAITGAFFLRTSPAPAGGASLTVATNADTINSVDNLCSLREAMNVARTNSLSTVPDDCGPTAGHATDPDTITLQNSVIYNLVAGATDDTGDLDGGGGPLVIQKAAGAGITTIDPNDNDRALETHSSVTTVTDVRFNDGTPVAGCGGAINASANLTLTRVEINGNASNEFGGGVCVNSAALTMSDSEVFSNSTSNATPALGQGGGIRLIGDGITHTITRSLIFNNSATGNGSDLVIIGTGPTVNITNSTFRTAPTGTTSSVSAQGGTTINLLNVTGVTNSDNAVLLHSGGGAINARNSIFDKQQDANVCVDSNTVNSLGHNIEDGTSCGLDGPNDKPNQNPQLAALALNGGLTRNFALNANSPAIDAADNANCPDTDQRAVNRPIGNACDMGSFESAFVSTPTPSSSPTPSPTATPSPTPTSTVAPSETPDPTNGSTPPPPDSPTPSVTPTGTGGATPTGTSTGAASPTGTGGATPTPTATATPTPTGTGPTPTGGKPTPTVTPTPTAGPSETPGPGLAMGDVQCDDDVDSVDALQQLRDVAGLTTFQEDGCPQIGAAGAIFGDVDCDGDVDSVDALKVLRHVAALSVTQTEPCTAIGDPL